MVWEPGDFIDAIGLAFLVVGGAFALWKYRDAAEKQYRRPFWERKISLYFEATSTASILATSTDEKSRSEAESKFWELYYGPLAVVEDVAVAKAMIKIRDLLKESEENRKKFANASLHLANCCRNSIGKSWNIHLDDLTDSLSS